MFLRQAREQVVPVALLCVAGDTRSDPQGLSGAVMSQHASFPVSRLLVAYLVFISAFAPLSTDMYLPALPGMAASLQTTNALTSLTISCFLLAFALSMLIWGPYSDRVGRRPVLLLGSALYVVSSLGIAYARSIEVLLAWRVVQAIGSGGISSMSLAIVKDVMQGSAMTRVVTSIQTFTTLAPMLAPLLGGLLLTVTSWRGIFFCLAGCGLLAGVGGLVLRETIVQRSEGHMCRLLGRIGYVMGQQGFRWLLLVFSAVCMPFMGYLAVSSLIYQDVFQLTPQQFSGFFAVNAAMSLLGPLCYGRWFHMWSDRRFFCWFLWAIAVSGAALICFGHVHPLAFAALCAPIAFCSGATRPRSTVLMLNQLETDTGTMTALINSGGLLCGSASMFLCTMPFWPDAFWALGGMACVVGLLTLAGWWHVERRGLARLS